LSVEKSHIKGKAISRMTAVSIFASGWTFTSWETERQRKRRRTY